LITVTLLSIFANDAVAVPLCTTFPNHELRYVIDQSESLMLLASAKFKDKAEDVIKEGTRKKPIVSVEKISEGNKSAERVDLEETTTNNGGLMLYTSGTTSRPVCITSCDLSIDV
jgi:malonyl-CoA/methylmalonyl-CoA synthetase